jgi:hypothetical protein
LEPRELLTVSGIGDETFKALDFTATGSVAGTFTVDVQGQPVEIDAAATTATLAGKIVYNGYDFGGIQGGAISAEGAWKGGNYSGMWGIDGYANPVMDENGQLSGSVVIDQSSVKSKGDGLLNGTYNVDTDVTKSFFNTKDFSIGMVIANSDGSLTFKNGKLTPTEKTPFNVDVKPTWNDDGTIHVDVQVPGKVHKTKTADRSTAVTNIELYWAKGPSFSKKVGSALTDKIPVYWNEASGEYQVANLPSAPAGATHLLFVAKFDGKTKAAALALPTVSVAKTSVVEGDGTRGQKNHAVFTVTLSDKLPQPVTVSFTTLNVTAENTAKPGADFEKTSGSIVIPAGETQGEFKVPVLGDTTYEGDEKLSVQLTKAQNAVIGKGGGQAIGVIQNDDPLPSVSINDVTKNEGSNKYGMTKFTFTLTLSNPSDKTILVTYFTSARTASPQDHDYTPVVEFDLHKPPGKVTFAPRITTRSLTVLVYQDKKVEPDEWFLVGLWDAKNATIADMEGKGTILNDDAAGGQSAATSRDAALNQLAGPGQLAAYFEPLGRKKNDKDAAAADLILAAT